MANEEMKISEFPAAEEAADADVLAGVGGGVTKKFSFSVILNYIKSKLSPAAIAAAPADSIAVTEESSTAAQAHAVGSLLFLDDVLYLVTTAISIGDTIEPGTNVTATDVAARLASKQNIITASGVLQGDGTGGVTAKAVDTAPTANSTNLVTSGGVKSALTYQSLGSFSTLADLKTLLDTALGTMSNNTLYNIRVTASETVAPFTSSYVYDGSLIRSSASYASVLFEPMGQDNAVLCRRSQADGWTFQALATQPYVSGIFATKEFAYFTPIAINGTTPTTVQLATDGAYLCIIVGNASQSQIMTVLVGSTGNVSHTVYGSNTAFTVTDGSGNGQLTISYGLTNIRYAYFYSLNGAAVPTVVT